MFPKKRLKGDNNSSSGHVCRWKHTTYNKEESMSQRSKLICWYMTHIKDPTTYPHEAFSLKVVTIKRVLLFKRLYMNKKRKSREIKGKSIKVNLSNVKVHS